jgi:hypothetical protein
LQARNLIADGPGVFAKYIPGLTIQASFRTSSIFIGYRKSFIFAPKHLGRIPGTVAGTGDKFRNGGTRAKLLQFSVAVHTHRWYGFSVFQQTGVPCPTEQTAAKLADST